MRRSQFLILHKYNKKSNHTHRELMDAKGTTGKPHTSYYILEAWTVPAAVHALSLPLPPPSAHLRFGASVFIHAFFFPCADGVPKAVTVGWYLYSQPR